jgi:hypothetical protein
MKDTAIIEVSDSDSLDESNLPISHKRVWKLTQKGRTAETAAKKARTDAAVKQTQLEQHLELIDKVCGLWPETNSFPNYLTGGFLSTKVLGFSVLNIRACFYKACF